jgi:propanol-preferring alcohol dehydrogenase
MSAPNPTYKAIQVSASGELEITERPLLDPTGTDVRIRVEACGICHSDAVSTPIRLDPRSAAQAG